jgi:hypothetical protein
MSHPPQQGQYPPSWYPPQGQPPYGQYPPAPPPKKKSKAGLWIAVVAVVVVLGGAFAFTGWMTPGFFKKKLDTTSRATPEQLAQSFANAITEQAMFDQLWCEIRSKRSYTAEEMFAAAKDEAKLTNPVHRRPDDRAPHHQCRQRGGSGPGGNRRPREGRPVRHIVRPDVGLNRLGR